MDRYLKPVDSFIAERSPPDRWDHERQAHKAQQDLEARRYLPRRINPIPAIRKNSNQ